MQPPNGSQLVRNQLVELESLRAPYVVINGQEQYAALQSGGARRGTGALSVGLSVLSVFLAATAL